MLNEPLITENTIAKFYFQNQKGIREVTILIPKKGFFRKI